MWVHLPLSVSCFSQSARVSSCTWLTSSLTITSPHSIRNHFLHLQFHQGVPGWDCQNHWAEVFNPELAQINPVRISWGSSLELLPNYLLEWKSLCYGMYSQPSHPPRQWLPTDSNRALCTQERYEKREREDVWPCVGASPLTKVFRKQKCFSGLSDGHICVTSVIQHHKVRLGRWSWSPAMDPEECRLTSWELETKSAWQQESLFIP